MEYKIILSIFINRINFYLLRENGSESDFKRWNETHEFLLMFIAIYSPYIDRIVCQSHGACIGIVLLQCRTQWLSNQWDYIDTLKIVKKIHTIEDIHIILKCFDVHILRFMFNIKFYKLGKFEIKMNIDLEHKFYSR